ncbi:unnamed protein product [Darwinula stevensoni]|uniref:Uncharacterized protein n=1 Tax=Darwinula stevensoni TaxID=69355 RepID=A0A7R9FPL5_9CRUS|nr:unnamed protein product [Darwinula stevensoni]CAG0897757.1 unnamed protein product [Darwinula stevensoni]
MSEKENPFALNMYAIQRQESAFSQALVDSQMVHDIPPQGYDTIIDRQRTNGPEQVEGEGAGNSQLMCYVCQPSLVGDSKSQEEAFKVVTKLVQDFPGEKIGLCEQFNARNATFQKLCKDDRSVAVCLDISNGRIWKARGCGKQDQGKNLECGRSGSVQTCMCDDDRCNMVNAAISNTVSFLLVPVLIAIGFSLSMFP